MLSNKYEALNAVERKETLDVAERKEAFNAKPKTVTEDSREESAFGTNTLNREKQENKEEMK